MKIKLPGYKSIVPNEVFEKDASDRHPPSTENVSASELIRLTKFRVPTQDEVIDFIRTHAKLIDLNSMGKYRPSDEEIKRTYSLKLFPASEIKNITEENSISLRHLREHYPKNSLQEGRVYIRTFSGVLPSAILDSLKESAEKEGSRIYQKVIEQMGSMKMGLRIRLEENGLLPDASELEYLLNRGVRESDLFAARTEFIEYRPVADRVRIISGALSSPELIAKVTDDSYFFLEQRVISTVETTAGCLASKNTAEGLAVLVGKIMSGFNSPDKAAGSYDVSLN